MKLYCIKLIILIIFLSVFIGCGTSKNVFSSHDPLTQLRNKIDRILSDSLFIPARSSIKVVSLNKGDILYERDSKALTNPASNIKLFTSAAALSLLDTNYLFKTKILVDAKPIYGVIDGSLYIKGFGDPLLSSEDIDSIAMIIKKMGIWKITQNIFVDNSYFDDNYWGAGWAWDDESDPDAPYIDALCANHNCITVTSLSDSSSTMIYLDPMTEFVSIINRSKLARGLIRTPVTIKRQYLANPNTILIDGDIARCSQVTKTISLQRPDYYVGTLFKESLRHIGITIEGDIINGIIPNKLQELVCFSRPLGKVITYMNKVSDNLSAENVLKILGAAQFDAPGTAKKGVMAEYLFLSSLGIDTTRLLIVDGSGVSRYNLLNTDQIVSLLTQMYTKKNIFPIFYNSLPIAGIDGTLSSRMTNYPSASNVRAKTGTLNGESNLSGYVHTRDGEMLVFSIMMQNFITSTDNYRRMQDRICSLLAGFSRYNLINEENRNETITK
jgi:serine-type D-Ala-D-Ala carboxypeptidase/endopeptidase (penicillin-binding protein 4)